MNLLRIPLLTIGVAIVSGPLARANLSINATFDSTITSNSNAAIIEAGINAAISRIEADIANTVTINIDFKNLASGLGQSLTYYSPLSYSSYLDYLANGQTLSANDIAAVASLHGGSTNPVDGNSNVYLNTALLKAMGYSHSGNDGTISLNLSLMNLSRTGTQNGSLYDLQAVAAHEIDEVLGIGGSGSILPSTSGPVRPLDLFRYSASGVRSFTTNSSATAYFSIDGGVTDLVNFNQTSGADYADWASSGTPQVQDAFGTPGTTNVNVGTNELTALDVIGYNLAAVPEPSTYALFGLGALAVVIAARRKQKA